jgi:hypothetical protein
VGTIKIVDKTLETYDATSKIIKCLATAVTDCRRVELPNYLGTAL